MAYTFPILDGKYLRAVPWDFMEPHRKQAADNHDQTLERLAERGGLSPHEAICAIRGIDIFVGEWADPDGLLVRYVSSLMQLAANDLADVVEKAKAVLEIDD